MLAASDTIWVLLSDNSWAYAEAASALQAEWRQIGRGKDLLVLNGRELPVGAPPAALVALGSSAVRIAMERAEVHADWARVPVVAGLLPKDGFQTVWKHPPAWVSAAYLDQPVERYLDLITRAFPRMRRIGVLVGAEATTTRAALSKAASDRGLHLVLGTIAKSDTVYASLRAVLADSDVLLVLPDSAVVDASALQNLLIAAYRQRVPVVAYSPSLVKAGATLGLYASPAQVGKQVATLLRLSVSSQSWPAPRLADGFTIAVNEQVCRSMGLDVPDAAELTEAIRRQEVGR